MGVPGLWDILRPAARPRALTDLAVTDGFVANPGGRRGLRVGIDASIWFYHAAYGKEGENPELRTLFFRCARLMSRPFLPLFVFDGPKRPHLKRGKKISGKDHWLTTGMQRIIESFGFEWRTAPGEAEAELAYLSSIGVIDAIISDDVDNFLFGATMIIRNPSKNLSGNKAHAITNSAGKEDEDHVHTFKAADFVQHEDISLTIGGLILIGLLRGGDYDQEGLPGCGPNIAHGLARCGFGDTLLEAVNNLSREQLSSFLVNWRHEVRQELRTNSRGFFNSKKARLAAAFPETFPDIDILLLYAKPVTSGSEGKGGDISYRWDREPDLGRLAGTCELYFEWGVKETIVKRFRTVIWGPAVLRILRRAVLEQEQKAGFQVPMTPKKKGKAIVQCGTPSTMITKHFSSLQLHSPATKKAGTHSEDEEDEPLILKIHSKREHASTDGVLEYRLEIAPAQLVQLTEAGVTGIRVPIENGNTLKSDDDFDEDEEEGGKNKTKVKKPPPQPDSHIRVWMPACMVRIVEPDLVEQFESQEEKKRLKKATVVNKKASTTKRSKTNTEPPPESELEEEEGEDFSDVFGITKALNSKASRTRRAQNLQPTLAEDLDETLREGSTALNGEKSNPMPPIKEKERGKTVQISVTHAAKLCKPRLKKSHSSPTSIRTGFSTIETDNDGCSADGSTVPLGTFDILRRIQSTSRDVAKGPKGLNVEKRGAMHLPMILSSDSGEDLIVEKAAEQRIRQGSKPLSKGNLRKKRSDSESSQEKRLQKSPRKSHDHASPRSKRIYDALGNDADIENIRPSSPTPGPTRNALAAPEKPKGLTVTRPAQSSGYLVDRSTGKSNISIIELSSDSDSPSSAPRPAARSIGAVHPLLVAQARATDRKVRTDSSKTAWSTASSHSSRTVIDLTS